jgi:probable F420-dependent oxidoreductase
MKFVLSAAFNPAEQLVPLAIAAEKAGFEAITFSDHVVHPEKIDTPYPYTDDGTRRWEAFTPWVDPWVTIGALSSVTTRLRFTTNVFVLAMRNPFIAAKMIATAAVLSQGRVTLTIGVGWSNVEYELMGQDFRTRGRRTDEMIDVMRKLWTGEMVEHDGEFYRFDRLEMNPPPPERIPIWVGGISDPALRRAARNDGWLSDLQTSAEIADDLDGYRRLGESGVTHILTIPWVFYHGMTDDLEAKLDGIRRYGEDVVAAYE